MISTKITIKIDNKIIGKVKELAHQKRWTLNETYAELLENGLNSNVPHLKLEDLRQKQLNERDQSLCSEFIHLILEKFKVLGLVAIVETSGYIADYVLLFEEKIPENINQMIAEAVNANIGDQKIIQALKKILARDPPNLMWIQIAKSSSLVWGSSEAMKMEIEEQFERWINLN